MDNQQEARLAVQNAKRFIKRKHYREASACMRKAMKLFPEVSFGLDKLIVCETLYYADKNYSKLGIDWYSVLHLQYVSTDAEVEFQCYEIGKYIAFKVAVGFPGANDAFHIIKQAMSIMCDKAKRLDYDMQREHAGLIDFPRSSIRSLSFKEDYFSWKPPVFRLSFCLRQCQVDDEESLWMRMKQLMIGLFEKRPQNPSYAPLDKYIYACDEMMIELDMAFVSLLGEFCNLEDLEKFWTKLGCVIDQLNKFEEMGYDVMKLIICLRSKLDSFTKQVAQLEKIAYSVEKLKDILVSLNTSSLGKMVKKLVSLNTSSQRKMVKKFDASFQCKIKKFLAELEEEEIFLKKVQSDIEQTNLWTDECLRKIDILKNKAFDVLLQFASSDGSRDLEMKGNSTDVIWSCFF